MVGSLGSELTSGESGLLASSRGRPDRWDASYIVLNKYCTGPQVMMAVHFPSF
jgi:hypothetical protein